MASAQHSTQTHCALSEPVRMCGGGQVSGWSPAAGTSGPRWVRAPRMVVSDSLTEWLAWLRSLGWPRGWRLAPQACCSSGYQEQLTMRSAFPEVPAKALHPGNKHALDAASSVGPAFYLEVRDAGSCGVAAVSPWKAGFRSWCLLSALTNLSSKGFSLFL